MRIPSIISLKEDGQYCIKCFSNKIKRTFKNGLTFYYCNSCGETLDRSLVIDNKIIWWVDELTREYWHESVGIFVFNDKNKALFFKRTIYPFAITIPAGHLDSGENPQTAVKRELSEETGIILKNNDLTLFSEEDVIGDKCRRGADNHKWHLYISKCSKSNVTINDEGAGPVWLSLEEALKHDLVYPVKFFIEKYGNKLSLFLS